MNCSPAVRHHCSFSTQRTLTDSSNCNGLSIPQSSSLREQPEPSISAHPHHWQQSPGRQEKTPQTATSATAAQHRHPAAPLIPIAPTTLVVFDLLWPPAPFLCPLCLLWPHSLFACSCASCGPTPFLCAYCRPPVAPLPFFVCFCASCGPHSLFVALRGLLGEDAEFFPGRPKRIHRMFKLFP